MVAVPFVVRALLAVLRVDPCATSVLLRPRWEPRRCERGGRSTFASVRRPLLAGLGFSAAISLGEFGATTILTRSGSETLPIAIGRLLGRAGALPQAQAFAMATILLLLTTALVTASGVQEQAGVDDA